MATDESGNVKVRRNDGDSEMLSQEECFVSITQVDMIIGETGIKILKKF